MKKNKNEANLSFLYLSILALLTAIGLEVLGSQYEVLALPALTMNLTISTVYVLAASFMAAFVANVKIAYEQKYILYLVILAITFFRVMALMKGLL